MSPAETIYTIGHSTRSLEELFDLLEAHGVLALVDVRRFPGSRRHPHFGRASLEAAAERRGLDYRWVEELGGRRKSGAASPNAGLRNASFRAYADHMATPEFAQGLAELLALARRGPPAVMCSEAVYWRCHRRLLSDALVARGLRVRHILGPRQVRDHTLTPEARVEAGQVTYPGEPELFE